MSANINFDILTSTEDTWNYSRLIASKTENGISKEDVKNILLNAVSSICKDKNLSEKFVLSDFHFYQSEDFIKTSSLNVETDILEFTKNRLVGDCYAYDASTNNFIAKLFFQYCSE